MTQAGTKACFVLKLDYVSRCDFVNKHCHAGTLSRLLSKCNSPKFSMPREQCPSHSKASTEADVPASESTSLFFGNGLKLILISTPQTNGPNVQTVGRVVFANSWLLLPNKFVLTSIQEQNNQGPRKFLTMCWSMLWHHQPRSIEE